jgi:hypothetical protein
MQSTTVREDAYKNRFVQVNAQVAEQVFKVQVLRAAAIRVISSALLSTKS